MRLLLASLSALLMAAACPTPQPGPVPSAYERCIEAQYADPAIRNVAVQTGTQLATLAERVCSDPATLRGYE